MLIESFMVQVINIRTFILFCKIKFLQDSNDKFKDWNLFNTLEYTRNKRCLCKEKYQWTLLLSKFLFSKTFYWKTIPSAENKNIFSHCKILLKHFSFWWIFLNLFCFCISANNKLYDFVTPRLFSKNIER